MKRSLLTIAVIAGFMFLASSVFANPALLPKKHEGYPNQGQGTTATGAAAELRSQQAENAVSPTVKEQVKSAESSGRAGNVITDDPRQRKHPGYPETGVTEGHIKNATKVNAEPK